MNPGSALRPRPARPAAGFTLIEVAIASAVLAIALFAILQICAVCIRSARSISRIHVDASSLAAELSLTNRLEAGDDSGNFGDLYPGYSWSRSITEFNTNGLYLVEFVVSGGNARADESRLSLLFFRPDSVRRLGR